MNRNLRDNLNLASKLTPRKISNAWNIYASYKRSKRTGNPWIKGLPISVSIEPTTSCNLRCPECPSGLRSFSRPTGILSKEDFSNTIEQLQSTLIWLQFYFQGEPYLNPDFLDMVKIAGDKGIYTATSTNAHYLGPENAEQTVRSGLDRLIVSIDGTTQDTYESYRVGGDLEKVLEGTRNVVLWKKRLRSSTPHIVFQFLVVKPNQHQIGDVRALARKVGANEVALKTAQIYDYVHGSELIPTIDMYSRYREEDNGKWSIKNSLDNSCWRMWNSCVITWDGKVVPCCFDKDASHQLGDLSSSSFRELWHGEAYQEFRSKLLKSRSEIDICRNCSEGTKVFA